MCANEFLALLMQPKEKKKYEELAFSFRGEEEEEKKKEYFTASDTPTACHLERSHPVFRKAVGRKKRKVFFQFFFFQKNVCFFFHFC